MKIKAFFVAREIKSVKAKESESEIIYIAHSGICRVGIDALPAHVPLAVYICLQAEDTEKGAHGVVRLNGTDPQGKEWIPSQHYVYQIGEDPVVQVSQPIIFEFKTSGRYLLYASLDDSGVSVEWHLRVFQTHTTPRPRF